MTRTQRLSFLGEVETNYGSYGYLRSYSAAVYAQRAGLATPGGMHLVDWTEAGLALFSGRTKAMIERTRLTHVAIRFRGKVYALPAPNRHHHVIREIIKQNPDVCSVSNDEQGFLDEGGHFLNRSQALVSAQLFDQLRTEPRGVLTSEDLW